MRRLLVAIALLSACYTPAVAGTFKFSGTIAGSDFTVDPGFDELTTTFSGVARFADFIDRGGLEFRPRFRLSQFDPVTIGSTVFSVANVFADLTYSANNEAFVFRLFGDPNGVGVVGRTDDFFASFSIRGVLADQINRPSGQLSVPPASFSVSSNSVPLFSFARTDNSTLTIAPVPLPATLPLLAGALGLCLVGARRMTSTPKRHAHSPRPPGAHAS